MNDKSAIGQSLTKAPSTNILWSLKFEWPDRIAYVFLFSYAKNADVTYMLTDAT